MLSITTAHPDLVRSMVTVTVTDNGNGWRPLR